MSESSAPPIGQVSADGQFRWDGQQWAPIPKGVREPTSWTRPMQLAAGALFTINAVSSLVFALLYENHAAMVQAIKAQGTQVPAGMTIDQLADTGLAFAIGAVVVVAILALVAAVGSFLGWRWMFWVALVLFAFSALGTVANIGTLVKPSTSPYPIGALVFSELTGIAGAAIFVWMLVAVIKFGPWAMKKPGT